MAQKTRKRKDTVWIPNTIQLVKRVGARSVKRARFLLQKCKRKAQCIPSKLDRILSKSIRRLTR